MITATMLIAVLAAVLAAVVVAARRPADPRRWLRWAALATTALVAALLTPYTVADSGAAAGYLLGVPVGASALPVVADRIGIGRTAADIAGALIVALWGLLLALGLGAVFFPGAVLMFSVVALDVTRPRRQRPVATTSDTRKSSSR